MHRAHPSLFGLSYLLGNPISPVKPFSDLSGIWRCETRLRGLAHTWNRVKARVGATMAAHGITCIPATTLEPEGHALQSPCVPGERDPGPIFQVLLTCLEKGACQQGGRTTGSHNYCGDDIGLTTGNVPSGLANTYKITTGSVCNFFHRIRKGHASQ